MLKYAMLGFLNYRSLSGYDLKRIMDVSTTNFWVTDLSQIYKALKSLEADGAITSSVEAQDDKPDRRVYTITDEGRADLQDWLDTPLTDVTPMKEALLLKMFFSANADRQQLITQLVIQRELHKGMLQTYQGQTLTDIEQNAGFMGATPEDALFWDMTRRAGVLYEEMYIAWLDETIKRLRGRKRKQ